MAKKMWIWRNPDLETGEKGVLMLLRMNSFAKWKTKHLTDLNLVKQHYNLLMGEHMEVHNPCYTKIFKDYFETHFQDLDLWFHATNASQAWTQKKTKGIANNIPNLRMPAVCYLINQDYWTPDHSVAKKYTFICCCNDLISYKRPDAALRLWEQYRKIVKPDLRFLLVYSNTYGDLEAKCKRDAKRIGNVDLVRSPSPDEIRQFYRQSEMLLHLSATESAPRVIGEAMSCGIPCVIPVEPWAQSVAHLHRGCKIINKDYWKRGIGVSAIESWYQKIKNDDFRSMVNTKGNLDTIDRKLATFNNKWTLGNLKPPHFIGEHISEHENDALFTRLTGQPLI